jgi:hypothetical protein
VSANLSTPTSAPTCRACGRPLPRGRKLYCSRPCADGHLVVPDPTPEEIRERAAAIRRLNLQRLQAEG